VACTTEKIDPKSGRPVVRPCRYPIARGDRIYVGFGEGPVCFNYDFAGDLAVGDLITFENGTIRTQVLDGEAVGLERRPQAVLLEVLEEGSGRMSPSMGASVPGKLLHVPRLSPRDGEAIAFGCRKGIEWYALSFTREPEDLLHLDRALAAAGDRQAGLIAKIEEASGIAGLEAIVEAGRNRGRPMAVMIARGDLFIELPWVKLAAVQTDLIGRCRRIGVPAIVATGLLLSMQHGPAPSRSEVCDVAAAVTGGADSLLLSDETSNGKNPARAVETLAKLLAEYGHPRVPRG
jgi:pyruvate kinase